MKKIILFSLFLANALSVNAEAFFGSNQRASPVVVVNQKHETFKAATCEDAEKLAVSRIRELAESKSDIDLQISRIIKRDCTVGNTPEVVIVIEREIEGI